MTISIVAGHINVLVTIDDGQHKVQNSEFLTHNAKENNEKTRTKQILIFKFNTSV